MYATSPAGALLDAFRYHSVVTNAAGAVLRADVMDGDDVGVGAERPMA